jgi:nicotinamidase/pyrazinamidase
MNKTSVLLIVDLQNDFCEGGNFAVPEGSLIIPLINQLQRSFSLVVASQDWHPANHTSFASNHPGCKVGDQVKTDKIMQTLWPDHCVQESAGAKFHPMLATSRIDHIFHKGVDTFIDSYSAFFDNENLRATGLESYLRERGVTDVYIAGLATDYCVKYSALDGIELGFNIHVIADACRGINIFAADDAEVALNEMRTAGVQVITSDQIFTATS